MPSSLRGLAAAVAAQIGFNAPVTIPSGATFEIPDVNRIKFEEWSKIKSNAPKGPIQIALWMDEIEKALPEETDLAEKVDHLFQSLHQRLTPHFNRMFDVDEKKLITEGHLSTLQQRLAAQCENEALETIWTNRLSELFQFPEGVPLPVGHEAIRAWLKNPDNRAQILAITTLDLQNLSLPTLPPEIALFTGLTHLTANHNQIFYLPDEIVNLTALTNLFLNHNKLITLPNSFSKLTALIGLELSHNNLRSFPNSLRSLSNLESLQLSHNEICSVPEWIDNLSNLTRLILYANQLNSLPESLGSLRQLANLNLSLNRFNSLPEPIRSLRQLQSLYLNHNQLTSLPDWISDIPNLAALELSHNPLRTLPEPIQRLTALRRLCLDSAQLRSLPEWIDNLRALSSLSLRNNQLTFLPECIANMPGLRRLRLKDNWLFSVPEFPDSFEFRGNPFLLISALELGFHDFYSLEFLRRRQKEMLEYPSGSSLASLFQLIVRGADVSEIQNTFDELDEQLKTHIIALVRQESEHVNGPTCSSNEALVASTSSNTNDESLFADMGLFAKSVRTATYTKFNGLSLELQKQVHDECTRLAGNKDVLWGEANGFNHVLRFIDALETTTASAPASLSNPQAEPVVAPKKKWPTVMTKPGFRSRG